MNLIGVPSASASLNNLSFFVSAASQLIATYLTSPYLAGVRLDTTTYTYTRDAEVSQQMLINVASTSDQGKRFISDNIAPRPRSWHIEGYISSTSILEVSALYMPTLAVQQATIEAAASSRAVTTFKTKDAETLSVVITHLEISTLAEARNKIPITVDVQEVVALTTYTYTAETPSGLTNVAASSTAVGGTTAVEMTSTEEYNIQNGMTTSQLSWYEANK